MISVIVDWIIGFVAIAGCVLIIVALGTTTPGGVNAQVILVVPGGALVIVAIVAGVAKWLL